MLNFFKKKKIDRSVSSFKDLMNTNITDIWEIEDKNSFIIAMDSWVCKKCNYGDDMDKLSLQERVFFITQRIEAEVNNGGFSQYFYNSSGNFANELFDSFIAIGAEKTAQICKRAVEIFGCKIPTDRAKRDVFLDQRFTDDINAVLNECDNMFYEYLDNIEELNYQYISKNKEYFN